MVRAYAVFLRGLIDDLRTVPDVIEPLLGANNEEGFFAMDAVKALEVEVAAVHHVECSGFEGNLVEGVDIVLPP